MKIKSFIPSPQPTEKMRHWLDSMFKSQEIYLTAPSRRVESRPPPMHFYKYLSSLSLCLQALLYLLCQPLSICLPMSHLSRYQLPIATCLPTNLCARNFRRLSLRVQFPDPALLQHLNQNHHHPLGSRILTAFLPCFGVKSKSTCICFI